MKNKEDLVKIGFNTAKAGFKNEQDVIDVFNNWKNSDLAKSWLISMNYNISEIEYVNAVKLTHVELSIIKNYGIYPMMLFQY